jgi:endonuclease YncB( thermonuclease family)
VRIGIFLGCLLLAPVTSAETIIGKAHVVDGDCIRIGETEIRIHRIDALGAKRMCKVKSQD